MAASDEGITPRSYTTDRGWVERQAGIRLAWHSGPSSGADPTRPTLLFCGGYRSDMTGSKASMLMERAARRGQRCVLFDYSAHGASDGVFEDGCIGDWAADALAVLDDRAPDGRLVIIGSSMGGWIACLLVRALTARGQGNRLAGLVGIAVAPDYTEDLVWPSLDEATRTRLRQAGRIEQSRETGGEPDVMTWRLIEEGRRNLVLRTPLTVPCPMRLIHGTRDEAVPWQTSHRLLDHADCADARLTLVKDGDHRLSDAAGLDLLWQTVASLG